MKSWKLQDAKAQFSEVVKQATLKGPQEITLRGQPAVIILSKTDFDRLTTHKNSFVEFMRESPLAMIDLKLKRDNSLTRDVDL